MVDTPFKTELSLLPCLVHLSNFRNNIHRKEKLVSKVISANISFDSFLRSMERFSYEKKRISSFIQSLLRSRRRGGNFNWSRLQVANASNSTLRRARGSHTNFYPQPSSPAPVTRTEYANIIKRKLREVYIYTCCNCNCWPDSTDYIIIYSWLLVDDYTPLLNGN